MNVNVLKRLRKYTINDRKWLPNTLKFIKKINSTEKYDEYVENLLISIIDWIIDLQIRAFIIFICIFCLSASIAFLTPPTPRIILLAEGSSFLWFLLIELKRDLWRK